MYLFNGKNAYNNRSESIAITLTIKNVKNDRPELTQGETPACPGSGGGSEVKSA